MTGISPSNPPQSPVHEAAEAATNTAPVEVDTRPVNDSDSTLSSEISTYTASLTSSVLNYPTEFGRQYHAYNADSYNFPNDEAERERLDLTHLLITKGIGNRLFLAPVDLNRSARVLDIGTGTGIWAICVGEEYPSAEIIGNDLSAIQPTWVPPNVKFEVDDVEQPWVHDKFDYIFSRYMSTSILDWPKLVENVFEHLHPGGWAEFQDFDLLYYSEDGSITDDHHLLKWMKLFIDTARTKLNREPCPGPRLEGWIRHAGFTNVVHRKFRLPLGSWPKDPQLKDIGMCNIAQLLEGLEAFSLKIFCGVLGMPMDEVLVMLAQIRQELYARKYHALFDFHVVYGQKP
ncbi:hypothetical protein FOXG_14391 [Fusarium oxysporum f. sp. lycopersici 4287]|uniref:Secondary metabolism regulator LAE1 n=3 Tax=Fusarium oxysporum TaxID=5507 RepID=A0A0J9W0J1_FUSO4|nr:hypothetical protein FOXG_14391 [Fusarium oxysporum f. sp. lycopersici 4287]KNB16563.1 hypothetical protein FOXG_14391 [Fusarium oxysporum f. sp. lycopersici 4287]